MRNKNIVALCKKISKDWKQVGRYASNYDYKGIERNFNQIKIKQLKLSKELAKIRKKH